MLHDNGQSGLKSIVAQCLASLLQMEILSETLPTEKMFDLDLYQHSVDKRKKEALKSKLEHDPYLKYLIKAIKHAVGEDA